MAGSMPVLFLVPSGASTLFPTMTVLTHIPTNRVPESSLLGVSPALVIFHLFGGGVLTGVGQHRTVSTCIFCMAIM
jgi:hypothetical protein